MPSSIFMRLLTSAAMAGLAVHAADPVRLTTAHVDIRIVDRPGQSNRLDLQIVDEDSGITYPSTNAILVLPTSARINIPEGFDVFGPSGSPLWVLPQSQDPSLLYLGISAEGIAGGDLESRFDIQLVDVQGPGHFFVWQFDTFSNLVMAMNSRDGIDDADRVRPLVGGHEHFNWGFTASGYHEISVRISNRIAGSTNVVSSGLIPLRFGVEPYTLPTPAQPATLDAIVGADGLLGLHLTGSPSRSYPIEASTDMANWSGAGSITTDATGTGSLILPADLPQRFFRARLP